MATAPSRELVPITFGPWSGGLNNKDANYSDRGIADNELISCVNLDVMENGSLVNRPGIVSYDIGIFKDILGDNVDVTLRNCLGALRLDAAYNEALFQFFDSGNNNVYVVKTSVNSGEKGDFDPGYWVKKNYASGSGFWLTSALRYDDTIYLTVNNEFLPEASDFSGGFQWGFLNTITKSIVTALTNNITNLCRDSAGNIYGLVAETVAGNDGKIVKIAGASVSDFATGLTKPRNMVCDGTNLYVSCLGAADNYGPILKISAAGAVSTFVAANSAGQTYWKSLCWDPVGGNLYAIEVGIHSVTTTSSYQYQSGWAPGPWISYTQVCVPQSSYSPGQQYEWDYQNGYSTHMWYVTSTPCSGAQGTGGAGWTQNWHYRDINPVYSTGTQQVTNNYTIYSLVKFDNAAAKTMVLADPNQNSNDATYDVQQLVIDAQQNLYGYNANKDIVRYNAPVTGSITATVVYIPQASLLLTTPGRIGFDSNGNMFISDAVATGKIIKITQSKTISVIQDNLNTPVGSVIDSSDNIYSYEQGITSLIKITFGVVADLISVADMPAGDYSLIIKDRMFIINKRTCRVYYSKATDPTKWLTTDGGGFFDIDSGDGQPISDVATVNDQLFIFKESRTFVFSFTSDPGALGDGYLRTLSTDRGAFSCTTYNNVVYLVGRQGVQRIINGYFIDLSQKIKNSHPLLNNGSTINVKDNKLVVTTVNDTLLIMNLLSGSWSTYSLDGFSSDVNPVKGRMVGVGEANEFAFVLAINGVLTLAGVHSKFGLDNKVSDATVIRTIPRYSFTTKVYDFDTPLRWKRLKSFVINLSCDYWRYSEEAYVLEVESNLYSANQKDVSTFEVLPFGNSDKDVRNFPIQNVTKSDFSSLRFQDISFDLYSSEQVVDTLPDTVPFLVIQSFSAYITQKASKGSGVVVSTAPQN